MAPDLSTAPSLVPFRWNIVRPPCMTSDCAPNSCICSLSAGRLCSATDTLREVAWKAYSFRRPKRSRIWKVPSFLLFLRFQNCLNCGINCKRSSLKHLIFYCCAQWAQKRSVKVFIWVRWSDTNCFVPRERMPETEDDEERHFMFCSVRSSTLTFTISKGAKVVFDAILQGEDTTMPDEKNVRTT